MKLMKNVLAKFLVGALLVSTVTMANPNATLAATKPVISKTEQTILEGKKFNLNINNKVKGSTYAWKTSNKKVATVNSRGIVTGITKGKVTITCVVTTPKTTYELKSKIIIRKPATKIAISNKVTALNVGQKYNLNRTLTPATSNDLTTLTTSDKAIANPKSNGVFTALKEGTVTITATTLSGAKDTVTIKVVDKDGIVTTQAELDALLGSGVAKITLKTNATGTFTIAKGDYSKVDFVIDAPYATVKNEGTFKSVTTNTTNNGGGSNGGGTPTPTYSAEVKGTEKDGITTFELPTTLSNLTGVTVNYGGQTLKVSSGILSELRGFLNNETKTIESWKNTTNFEKTEGIYTVAVTGTKGNLEKEVTVAIKDFISKTYTVTPDQTTSSVAVRAESGITYVIAKVGNDKLTIDNAPVGLTFTVTY